jgi:hypothetical protein
VNTPEDGLLDRNMSCVIVDNIYIYKYKYIERVSCCSDFNTFRILNINSLQ